MTGPTIRMPAVAEARVSPAEPQAAALVFARGLREHIAKGLRQGQISTALSGARCLEKPRRPHRALARADQVIE